MQLPCSAGSRILTIPVDVRELHRDFPEGARVLLRNLTYWRLIGDKRYSLLTTSKLMMVVWEEALVSEDSTPKP